MPDNMDSSFEDIENEIPVNNLQLSQGLTEVNVKRIQKNREGFTETRIERLKVQKHLDEQHRKICIARPFNRARAISNTICLSVQDVKLAKKVDSSDCWEVYSSSFRRVLVYGKIIVLNQFSKDGKSCFKFSIDDGTDRVLATMNISKETKRSGERIIICFSLWSFLF